MSSANLSRARRRYTLAIAAGSYFGATRNPAVAADPIKYPTAQVRWVVPYTPAGATDTVARVFGAKLQEKWGQPVIVDNRPGAASNIGMEIVARAPADGLTLLLATPTIATNPELFKGSMSFDPMTTLTGVSQIVALPNAIVVPYDSPFKSIQELIAHARANPGKLSYGSAGIGTLTHLGMEYFKAAVGVDITHVPYKGSAPVIQDLASNVLPLASDNLATHVPQIQSGRERALVVLGQQRVPPTIDVPCMTDIGYAGFDASGWAGVSVPAATPRAIIKRIATEIQRIAAMPDVHARFVSSGYPVIASGPDEFNRLIHADADKWQGIIRRNNVRLD